MQSSVVHRVRSWSQLLLPTRRRGLDAPVETGSFGAIWVVSRAQFGRRMWWVQVGVVLVGFTVRQVS